MKLQLFNPWRELATWSGITLQYQTTKHRDMWKTHIRDRSTKAIVTYAISRVSKQDSLDKAREILSIITIDGIKSAIETRKMVVPSQVRTNVSVHWRDGVHHRHRAQKKMLK